MHFAQTSRLLASISDELDTEFGRPSDVLEALIFQPDAAELGFDFDESD